jgi:hypothetical protein
MVVVKTPTNRMDDIVAARCHKALEPFEGSRRAETLRRMSK